MSIIRAVTAAAMFVATIPAATAYAGTPAAPRAGVYENVTSFTENGDFVGMAVELKINPKPSIVVTTCEGTCYGGKTWPVKMNGANIAFTVCDDGSIDNKGSTLPCTPLHYSGTFRTSNTLELVIDGAPDTRFVLKRVPRPHPRQVEELACLFHDC